MRLDFDGWFGLYILGLNLEVMFDFGLGLGGFLVLGVGLFLRGFWVLFGIGLWF